jgi:predicted small secreted protein
MGKRFNAVVAVLAFTGLLAAGCNTKQAGEKKAGQQQTEQKPAAEKAPKKPVGC